MHPREGNARNPTAVTVVEANGEGAALLETWKEALAVIVLDAAHSGTTPGKAIRENRNQELVDSIWGSHCVEAGKGTPEWFCHLPVRFIGRPAS